MSGSLLGCNSNTDPDARQTAVPESEVPAYSAPPDAGSTHGADETEAPSGTEPASLPTEVPTEAPNEVPTEAPTAVPTAVPDTEPPVPYNYVSIGTASKPARFTMPTDLYGVSQANCEAWFSDAVFCGDSITISWKTYNRQKLENDPNFFGQTHFLCEGSYGVIHAFDPISDSSLHPMYAGEQHYLWDSIAMMGANKVFLLFGLNDIAIVGVDGTAERFDQLTDRIKELSPNASIFVISTMYMYKGSEKTKLNNRNLYLLNQRLVQMCNRKGYEFINIASHLIDEEGFVPDVYSSDHYVHQSDAAYDVWADVLRSVAARHLKGIGPIVFTLPQ